MPSSASPPAGYVVRLDVFEGPLDLLLHLIRREEMDIYDIPIARITEQYLEYLEGLASLDLDTASEFLLVAATLMDIKSRMLLPRQSAAGDYIDEEAQGDPRRELVARLLEYKRYKEVASELGQRAEAARKSHSRYGGPGGPLPLPAAAGTGVASRDPLGRPGDGDTESGRAARVPPESAVGPGVTLATLVSALRQVLRELEERGPAEVERETLTVADRLAEVVSLLAEAGERGVDFVALLRRSGSRRAAVVTFVALLELLRQGRVRFVQERPFGPLVVWALPGLHRWGWPGRD